jgi:protein tyrosine phosphatase (PTP) superfamily phosphohydrolase (DUF442 family)
MWRETGSGVRTQCPAHDDRQASLMLREVDGRVLLHCHAGCRPDEVLVAWGLAWADIEPKAQAERVVARYPYRDAEGTLRYEVVRLEPKAFRRRQPDGRGGWVWHTQGCPPLLYRLPELLEAVRQDPDTLVWLVEGEKDVETLRRLGLVATTSGGAGSWKPAHTEALVAARVRRVAILPDADGPGQAHAEACRQACVAAGIRATIVPIPDLPEHGDVSDAVARGARAADLLAWWQRARASVLLPVSAVTSRPVVWLWEGRVPVGGLTILAGREGIGKSLWAVWLAAAVSTGRLGVRPAPVVYWAVEDDPSRTIRPRLEAAGADLDRVFLVAASLSLPEGMAALAEACTDIRPALVVCDPLLSRLASGLDAHRDQDVRQALEPLVRWAQEADTAVLGIAHVNKSQAYGSDVLSTVMGSRAFVAVARSVLWMTAEADTRLLAHVKCNLGPLADTVAGRVDGGVWAPIGADARRVEALLHAYSPNPEEDREIRAYLEEQLADPSRWPMPTAQVWRDARARQWTASALGRVRRALGIRIVEVSPGRYAWFPPAAPTSAEPEPVWPEPGEDEVPLT